MVYETLKLAGAALWAHKLRTFLTLLGVMIGVASVIAIISVLDGMMRRIANVFDEMGASTIYVTRFGIITSDDEWFKAIKRKRITVDDVRAIEKGVPLAEAVGYSCDRSATLKRDNRTLFNVHVQGISANAAQINNIEIEEGRFFTAFDDQHRRQLAIIGDEVKTKLFPFEDPLGKEILIRGVSCTVIGVCKKRGSILGENLDRFCYVPVQTLLKYTGRHQDIDIMVKVKSEELIDQAMDQIRQVMRARRHVGYHDPDDFGLLTRDTILGFVENFTGVARLVGIAIPAISVVVAGIVVMNIMMVSVTERTREIGIRKAVGARGRNILSQFLLEALLMSLMGGAIGLTGGLVISYAFSEPLGVPFVISPMAVAVGLLIPISIGVFFGIYPAWKAAKLDPVEAMRFES